MWHKPTEKPKGEAQVIYLYYGAFERGWYDEIENLIYASDNINFATPLWRITAWAYADELRAQALIETTKD